MKPAPPVTSTRPGNGAGGRASPVCCGAWDEEEARTSRRIVEIVERTVSDSAYSDADYTRAFPVGYERHFWHRARLRVVRTAIDRVGVARCILDVGCGPGRYVSALRALGYNCIGCDPGDPRVDADVAGHVFSRTAVEVLPREVRDEVDVVLLLDVIEHLEAPGTFLAGLVQALPALRTAIITVPARGELWSALDTRAGHHRRYTVDELTTVATNAGFVAEDARYLFRTLYPAAWLGRASRLRRTIAPPTRVRLHEAIGNLLAAEAWLLPASWPGTSALCVARRPSPGAPHA